MRETVIDWMFEVQIRFRLQEETMFLSVHILDAFLQRHNIKRTDLQLIACAAMSIASKYEEICAPELCDFVGISDNAFTKTRLLESEDIVLNTLNFKITVPTTPHGFLRIFAPICGIDFEDQVWMLSAYYVQLTLQSYSFLAFSASSIAAAALYLSMSTAKQYMRLEHEDVWTHDQMTEMQYTDSELAETIKALYARILEYEQGTAKYKAVQKKFSLSKYKQVARYKCKPPVFAEMSLPSR
jgi:cyclin B